MAVNLEEEKKRVELQRKKLQVKEKFLKAKERQRKFKRVSEIVEIAFKEKLDQIEDAVLLGAFLEISEKIRNPQCIEEWKKHGEAHIKDQRSKPTQKLLISFKNEPEKEIRDMLKKMKFRWHSFRREFYGCGDQQELENLLKESACSIERLNDE